MKSLVYSDATPGVTLTYNRLGRPQTATDALGTRTYSYDAALALIGESISGASNGYYDKLLTRTYDAAGFGRLSGIQVGTDFDPDADYAAAYGYDAATGRLARVTGPGLPTGTSADYGAFYEYEPNSELLKKISVRDDQNNTLTETLRAFEPSRDLVDYVENKWVPSATVVSKYD
ncbi:MAG: hypothetical protein CHACPFDD_03230 [Phycisphaerae bacterium]|nr:hypothetical protein [Phycisphaerae bacterium]